MNRTILKNHPALESPTRDVRPSHSPRKRPEFLRPQAHPAVKMHGSVGGHAMFFDPNLGGWFGVAPPIQLPRLLLT
jgi:hypothetical protein